ncbi:MAG TPA: nicotinate phosphoribosyltransferase [Acidimicrobiales bacterium]|nr:nicotinate phosphoribosyltransferase [Acidimicrobiales bacterium]
MTDARSERARPPVPASLVTDLYELTMAAAYQAAGIEHEATFELFVRRLPEERRFLVAAGLDDALAGLEDLSFAPHEVEYLAGLGLFPAAFIDRLADLRFTGEVWGIAEGDLVFAGEPIVRVTAPLVEAQLVETFLLNAIASRTMLASKAARVAIACGGRDFVDFSARRDHGVDAAMAAARGAWICGAAGTSLVAAGQRWGIPLSGTMAHSFVMSFEDERDAFRAYARSFPERAVLLIDTYDTVAGARHAAAVAQELAHEGVGISAVRLDSGDLGRLAVEVRAVLDEAGLADVEILASGDLDEHRIADLLAADAPIDSFGVGTQLGTSGDAPSLGAVYKLVDDALGPRMKLAEGKVTLPGRKQVWRLADRDVLGLHDEHVAGGRPLLTRAMAGGRRVEPPEALSATRARCMAALAALPAELRSLEVGQQGPVWPVEVSTGLRALADKVRLGLEDHQR